MCQLAAIEGSNMDSGSDDEVLEIPLLTVLLSRRAEKEIEKKDVGAPYSLPVSTKRRIPHGVTGNAIKRYRSTFQLLADVERAF